MKFHTKIKEMNLDSKNEFVPYQINVEKCDGHCYCVANQLNQHKWTVYVGRFQKPTANEKKRIDWKKATTQIYFLKSHLLFSRNMKTNQIA